MQKNYTADEITVIYNRNVDSIYRICYMYMKNKADTEDMTQNTFMKLVTHGIAFSSEEHEKAWLIRVAVNMCKNSLKSLWRKAVVFDEQADSAGINTYIIPEPDETLTKVMKLPAKLKTALYLHYYEGYATAEIARIMNKPDSTIRGYLHRGRKTLKQEIEADTEKEENLKWITTN